MRTILVLSQLLFSLLVCFGNQPDTLISCDFKEVAFNDFCNDLHQRTGTMVYCEASWTNNVKVTLHSDGITVIDAAKTALSGTGLYVSVWHNNLVVLRNGPLLTALPGFNTTIISGEAGVSAMQLTHSEEKYLKGRKAGDIEVIRVGKSTFGTPPAKVKVLGLVKEEETGEPVIGAAMFIEELSTGTITDQKGFLSIAIKPGTYSIRIEFLGFEKKSYQLEVLSSGDFTVELKKVVISIDEVVIVGDRQINITSRDPGLEKISTKTIREIPTMMGERDILKVSEMMPGIVSVGEGASGLNVRGGSSDQNAFYINKIPVFNTSHLFGFFPAFNSDIVKDFTVYKGYIPAQYGGRLSSVFNIITRQGNRKRFNAHAAINPVTGSLTVEGPLVKNKSSILVSGRASYSDWILKKINDPTIQASSAKFNDLAMSVNYDFKNSQVSLFGFNSYDFFKLSDLTEYEYGNRGASLNFRHNFNMNVQSDFTLIASNYNFSTVNMQEPTSAYEHNYVIDHYEARLDFNHTTFNIHHLEYGLNFVFTDLDRGIVSPYQESKLKPVDLGKEKGIEGSAYLADMLDVLPWLNVTAGFRFSAYSALGPETVFTYEENFPKESAYIKDSLQYDDNEPILWNYIPEIRASVNISTDPKGSVKLAFNQMHQSAFMLSNTISVAPNTQWKLSDYYLTPARSNLYSLGVFRNYPKGGWETSMEVYFKETSGFPEFKDGADFLDGSPMESVLLQGTQKSYGFELSVKRTIHKINGWLAYTYSRSLVTVDEGEIWNSINEGKTYPANYDIPHAFNALINYNMSRRVSLSTVFTYQSGRPITYPLAVYYVEGVAYTDYSERNRFRIPDYFRMDMSLTVEGNLKKEKFAHSSLVFSLYNLTGRKNAYSVYFQNEPAGLKSYKYSVIGVPIFTATWLLKLGNYASE